MNIYRLTMDHIFMFMWKGTLLAMNAQIIIPQLCSSSHLDKAF